MKAILDVEFSVVMEDVAEDFDFELVNELSEDDIYDLKCRLAGDLRCDVDDIISFKQNIRGEK